jgi:hypothetical protein
MKKIKFSDYRRFFPWIPIIGIPLVIVYHMRYHDVLMNNKPLQFFGSAFIQSLSITIPLIIIALF